MQVEMDTLKMKNTHMQEEINLLNVRVTSLEEREEVEITDSGKEALKEEITRAINNTMEERIEAKWEGWVRWSRNT